MGTGVSLFLIAAGAIMAFAIETRAEGFDHDVAGVILMIIGGIGLLWTLLLADDWGPRGSRRELRSRRMV